MLRITALMLAAVSAVAATPLEADFPDGYWDKEVGMYGGRASTMYNVSFAAADPAKARAEVEKLFAGAKLLNFSDQTAAFAGNEYGMGAASRMMRPAYSLSYQLSEAKAGPAAKRLLTEGRLLNYSVNTPFGAPQNKEIDERIAWIEKEKKQNAEALKTMPVSRSLLESKLKRLKAVVDMAKASAGTATVMVQISREDPEAPGKGAPMIGD
jgi:hypothetical protein